MALNESHSFFLPTEHQDVLCNSLINKTHCSPLYSTNIRIYSIYSTAWSYKPSTTISGNWLCAVERWTVTSVWGPERSGAGFINLCIAFLFLGPDYFLKNIPKSWWDGIGKVVNIVCSKHDRVHPLFVRPEMLLQLWGMINVTSFGKIECTVYKMYLMINNIKTIKTIELKKFYIKCLEYDQNLPLTCSRPYSAARSRGVSCWLFLIVGSVSSWSRTETTSECPYWAAQWSAVSLSWF